MAYGRIHPTPEGATPAPANHYTQEIRRIGDEEYDVVWPVNGRHGEVQGGALLADRPTKLDPLWASLMRTASDESRAAAERSRQYRRRKR